MSIYPEDFDSDLEIPRVDQNVSEISGDVINSLRDAIFAIQKTIGLNSQGNKPSFSERVNVSIDSNGRIKSDALSSLGLLTLPVLDKHIGINAGIQESKLALTYNTTTLKNLIDSLRTDVTGINNGLTATTSTLTLHTSGLGYFHDGYHIKINTDDSVGIAGLESLTVGDALNELSGILVSGTNTRLPHIDLDLPSAIKHKASGIFVDTTGFVTIDRTADDVQAVIDDLDTNAGILGVTHLDSFHANGVLKEINSGTNYNSSLKLLGPIAGVSYSKGTSVIQIPGVTSFASLGVKTGDIVEIVIQTGIADTGTFRIREIGPLSSAESLGDLPSLSSDELAIFHIFSEDQTGIDNVTINIYRPASDSSEFAPLACAVRNNETIPDTISVLNPGAARAVSVGFNGSILTMDGYEIAIRAGIDATNYRELVIPHLHYNRLGTDVADPVDATSVAERINAFVSDPDLGHHFPITAYRAGNELIIAHNLVGEEFTIEVVGGYTGNYALGFDVYGADVVGKTLVGNESSSYAVNGKLLTSLNTVFTGTVQISSDSSSFTLLDENGAVANPLLYGIGPGSVMHVLDHPVVDENGSYTLFTANSTTVYLFNPESISAPASPTTFSVMFTAADMQLSVLEGVETDLGLVQILVDSDGQTLLHQRLMYGTGLGAAVEIVGLSSSFPIGEVYVLTTEDSGFINFNIVADSIAGDTIKVDSNFKGSFKLYHPNATDYFVVKIISGVLLGTGIEIVSVNNPIPSDEAMLLCTAHFNGTLSVTNLIDNRLFGNISEGQVRDDFIETFSQRPVAELRSNGVVRGFDIMDLPYVDLVTGMVALPLRGGVAYINGVRVSVQTQKVVVPSYDSSGNLIVNARRIVGINDFGSLQLLSDDLGEIITDGYNASAVFGKMLPLYQFNIVNGGIENIIDIRKFINNLDDKIELIVDESNSVVGNFRSLEGALLYAENYPGHETLTIKIINSVYPQNPLIVPDGVSIIGGAIFGGNGKHQIINTVDHGQDFITFSGNNRLENVGVISDTAGLQGSLITLAGSNINIEKCLFRFDDTISTNNGDLAIKITGADNIRVVSNIIDNVYTGISCEYGCDNLLISGNTISGISGISDGVGIKLGTLLRSSGNLIVKDNNIEIDSVDETDLRGIFVDVGETISLLKIDGNSIIGLLDISSENHISNGIRIENVSVTGNKVEQLIVRHNYIKNIKLNDNFVYGLFIKDVEHAIISDNTIVNVAVYDSQYTDTMMIYIETNVDSVEINHNMLSNGEVLRGIYINNTATITSIVGNILTNVGDTDAIYVYGTAHRANISDNKLIGPGHTGIRWKGERSKISNNHISSSAPLTSYSFLYGIYIQNSYVDVVNNSIMDMNYDGSTSILNASTANEGMKIIGNTIEGTTIGKLVDLNGNYHVVSNNRLKNDAKSSGGDTIYISLGQNADGISIIGNIFEGQGSSCIYSSYKVTNISITNNVILTTSLTAAPIKLSDSDVAECIVMGNKLPDRSTYPTGSSDLAGIIIGPTPSYGALGSEIFNYNTIGVNRGALDTRGIHASTGIAAYDSTGTGTEFEHWVFNDTNDYWEVNSETTSDSRMLYFPINNLPNGAELISVQMQGQCYPQSGDTFKFYVKKRSVKTAGLTVTTMATSNDLSGYTEFSNSTTYSKVSLPDGQIVNYAENNYFIQVEYTKATPTNPDEIRVYGFTIEFRY